MRPSLEPTETEGAYKIIPFDVGDGPKRAQRWWGRMVPVKLTVPQTACLLVLLAGIICTAGTALGKIYSDRIVAVVNGDVILESDVDKHKEPMIRNLTNLNLGVVPHGKWPTERELLEELIVIKLLEQEANKKGISPDEKSVDASIDMVRKRIKFSEDQFVLFLAAKGLNYADFRNLYRRKIKLEGLVGREVTRKVPLSEEDLQRYFKENRGKIDKQY